MIMTSQSSQDKALVAISDWPTQLQALKLLFNADDLLVTYLDEEGDEIGIRTQKDYDYALELARTQLNYWLVLIIKNARGGQKIAETRIRVDKVEAQPKETKMSTAVQTAAAWTPERQANATQTNTVNHVTTSTSTSTTVNSGDSSVQSLIESQFSKFKKEIAQDIDNKLSLFMSQLARRHLSHTCSRSSPVPSIDSEEHDFELAQHPDDAELAARVAKMLKIRSDAEAVGRRLKLAYYEEELELSGAFNSEFIKDCNVPDGTQLRPHVKFEKMWMLKNTGKLEWSHETFPVKLTCVSGNIFVLNDNHVDVKNTVSSEIATVSVNLMTPSKPGSYFSEWRLSCNGYQFGPKIWCSIEVVDDKVAAAEAAGGVNSLVDLTTPVERPTTISTAATSFNNSSDSFEEVNTSSFHDNDDGEAEADKNFEDDILVVPDCFDLAKEWKKKKMGGGSRPSYSSTSTASECNVEIFEEGLESRQDLTSTHADTSLNSSFCQELDSTIGKEGEETTSANNQETTVVVALKPAEPAIKEASPSSSSSSSSAETSPHRTSFDEEVIKNVSDTIGLMKNAFKNLSGPSYVGYVCDLETNNNNNNNKENNKPASSNPPVQPSQPIPAQQHRDQLLKRIAHNYDSAPAKKELTSMEKLMQMGFANRALNERLLRAYNDDIQKVVQHLTQRSDSNWSH